MQGMSLVDVVIWILVLVFMVKGYMRGLVREVCSLTGMVAGGWAAFRFHGYLSEAARPLIQLPPSIATVLSFVFIFLVVGLLFFLVGHLLTVVLKVMLLGGINRVGGIVFGGLEGAFIICMSLYFLTSKPVPEKFKGYLLRSPTGHSFIIAGRDIAAGWENRKKTTKRTIPAGT